MAAKCKAIYLRLSHEDGEAGESNSITNQRELLKAFIAASPDLCKSSVAEFCDDGFSGTSFERPGLKDMLDEVRAGNIDCVIVKDLSRFGRNYIETGNYIEQIFPFMGVRFISVNDRFDSQEHEGGAGSLDIAFRNLIYDLYSKDLSRKTRSAKLVKMRKGCFLSSLAPYGYAKSKEDRHKLVVDETAAAVVRRIFEMADKGLSAVRIAARLNAEAIPTPLSYKRLNGCRRYYNTAGDTNYWLNSTILSIIRDERYTGKMVNGRYMTQTGFRHSKRVTENQWLIVDGTHEAIVSEELFASVQGCFKGAAGIKKQRDAGSPLLGKVRCGKCHHAMKRRGAPSARYICGSRAYIDDSCCRENEIAEDRLEEIVLSVIRTMAMVYSGPDKTGEERKAKSHTDPDRLIKQIRRLQSSLEKMKLTKMEAYEQYADGRLEKELFVGQKTKLSEQIEEIGLRLRKLEFESEQQSRCYERPESGEDPTKHSDTAGLTKEIADALVDTVYVYSCEAIEIVWSYAAGTGF